MTPNTLFKKFNRINSKEIVYSDWIAQSKPGLDMDAKSKVNQDNFTVIKEFLNLHHCLLAIVCDGHGTNGHIVSNYLCKTLPSNMVIRYTTALYHAAFA